MAAKRKISIRKILQVFLTLVTSTCCVMAIVSASRIEDNKTLKSVAIHFRNDKRYHFIEEQEIMDLAINKTHTDIAHTPLSKLNIHKMEELIMADPWVAFAQVYVDNERVLHLYVTQRLPVVRIFQQNGRSFYLDTTLSIMPLSPNYVYYSTVVTNVPELRNDSMGWALRKDIVTLVKTIQRDSFWNAQISQVIVDSPGMFEFVPILGDHRIIFGGAVDIKEKLGNLFTFYKNVLNKIGWDKYQTLDVRFRGQVVASPSLPYNGPVDKEVGKMNWINSIVETEAANDSMRSGEPKAVKDTSLAAKPKPVVKPIAAAKQAAKPVAAAKKAQGKPVAKKPVAAKPTGKQTTAKQATKQTTKQTDKKKQPTPKYLYPEKKH